MNWYKAANTSTIVTPKQFLYMNLATDEIVDPISAANALKSKKLMAYSTQHNYSEEYGNNYMDKLKSISGFHESP